MRVFLKLPFGSAGFSPDTIRDADAVIVDCTNGVVPDWGSIDSAHRAGIALFARTSMIDAASIEAELAAIMPKRPAAIVLPLRHGRDIAHLGARLAVHEAENGWSDGETRIVAMLESAEAALHAASLVGVSRRLAALGWDTDAVARDLGMSSGRPDASAVLAQVRAQVRLAAAAAGVLAVETAYPAKAAADFRAHVAQARRDGFGATVATGAEQIALAKIALAET